MDSLLQTLQALKIIGPFLLHLFTVLLTLYETAMMLGEQENKQKYFQFLEINLFLKVLYMSLIKTKIFF